MYNKRVLSTAVSELGKAKKPTKKRDNVITAKRHQTPIVTTQGFKQGPPPVGTNYRIPGDTLYNPTPYPIEAVSDNGIRKTLNPFDTSNIKFPGANYVDEYEKKEEGGEYYDDELTQEEIDDLIAQGYIVEDLPKAQLGKGTTVEVSPFSLNANQSQLASNVYGEYDPEFLIGARTPLGGSRDPRFSTDLGLTLGIPYSGSMIPSVNADWRWRYRPSAVSAGAFAPTVQTDITLGWDPTQGFNHQMVASPRWEFANRMLGVYRQPRWPVGAWKGYAGPAAGWEFRQHSFVPGLEGYQNTGEHRTGNFNFDYGAVAGIEGRPFKSTPLRVGADASLMFQPGKGQAEEQFNPDTDFNSVKWGMTPMLKVKAVYPIGANLSKKKEAEEEKIKLDATRANDKNFMVTAPTITGPGVDWGYEEKPESTGVPVGYLPGYEPETGRKLTEQELMQRYGQGPRLAKGGSLLTKKVTCKNCGWEWNAADGGDDVTTCHKCGGQGLVHAQFGFGMGKLRKRKVDNQKQEETPAFGQPLPTDPQGAPYAFVGERPACPEGQVWDENLQSCVLPGIVELPTMYASADPETNKKRIKFLDKANALWDTVEGRKVWMENAPKNYSLNELSKFVHNVKDYKKQAEVYEKYRRMAENDEISGDEFGRLYRENNWIRFDQKTDRENVKGQWRKAAQEGIKKKAENAKSVASDIGDILNTAGEYTGVNSVLRTVAHPIDTLSGAGQTIVDIGMAAPQVPYMAYDYLSNLFTPWNREYGNEYSGTEDINPFTGQPYWSGAQGAIDLAMAFPFFKLGTTAATAGIEGTINAVNKIPASKVLLQSAETRLGNPTAYGLLSGTETGVRGRVAEKYFENAQKSLAVKENELADEIFKARQAGNNELADQLSLKTQELWDKSVQLDQQYANWRKQYSGLPIEETGMGGGEGRIYSLKDDPNQLVKVGHSFNTEDELAKLVEVGKTFDSPGTQIAFPTRYVPFGKKQFAQFMPKLDYSPTLPFNKSMDDLTSVVNDLNAQGVGLDYRGIGNIGSVGDDLGLVDLTYIGKPGQRTNAFAQNPSIFDPSKSRYGFKLQENLGSTAQGIADDAAGLMNRVRSQGLSDDALKARSIQETGAASQVDDSILGADDVYRAPSPEAIQRYNKAIEHFNKHMFLPESKSLQGRELLDDFISRINSKEGLKRLGELGINDPKYFEDLVLKEIQHELGYFTEVGGQPMIALHTGMPAEIAKNITRHEIEHAVQRAIIKNGQQPFSEIDYMLNGLTLKGTPNVAVPREMTWNAIEFPKNADLFPNAQKNLDYYAFGSGGKEKSAFLAEVQQGMLDNGIIDDVYENITPEKVKKAYKQFIEDSNPDKYNYRFFEIMEPTEANFELTSKALNKMLAIPGAIGGVGTAGYMMNQGATEQPVEGLKKGGTVSKKYSRSLEAKNQLYTENRLVKKRKPKTKKIFSPTSPYFQAGGENQVECDDDGRCYETDQIQNILDNGSYIPKKNVNIMWDVAETPGAYENAKKIWTDKGAQVISKRLGNTPAITNVGNCMWAAGMGYQCLPETKGKISLMPFESNDKFINAVNKGAVPFSRVAKTHDPNFASQETGMLQQGDIINFKGAGNSHAMTFSHYDEDGTPIFLDSNGQEKNFGWNRGMWDQLVPNKEKVAYVSRFNPEKFYEKDIKTLEEQARTNPTYIPGTQTIGKLPLLPLANLEIPTAERVLPTVTQTLGMRQFGGIPTLPLNKGRQVLRDWTYGQSIGMLQEKHGGVHYAQAGLNLQGVRTAPVTTKAEPKKEAPVRTVPVPAATQMNLQGIRTAPVVTRQEPKKEYVKPKPQKLSGFDMMHEIHNMYNNKIANAKDLRPKSKEEQRRETSPLEVFTGTNNLFKSYTTADRQEQTESPLDMFGHVNDAFNEAANKRSNRVPGRQESPLDMFGFPEYGNQGYQPYEFPLAPGFSADPTRGTTGQPVENNPLAFLTNTGILGQIDHAKLARDIEREQNRPKYKNRNVEPDSWWDNTVDALGDAGEYILDTGVDVIDELGHWKNMGKRYLQKKGWIDIEEQHIDPNKARKIQPKIKETPKVDKFYQEIATVKDEGYSDNDLLSYRSQWDNNEGFVYIATPTRGGRTNKEEYKNVKGVGHFLLDASAVPGKEYQHEYNRAFLEKAMKNNDWIPTFTPVSGDKVRLKYKKPKEITKEDKVLSPLRQFKFDNLMFDNTRRPEGFQDPIKEVLTKDNKGTYLIFKNKDGYSRFSGGSVVFIFKDKYGNTIVRDFAGTLNNIKDEGKAIKEQYGLKDGSLTIGYHDVGSFSAKPKADKSGVLRSSQWYDFNTGSMTGGALLIPNQ